MPTYEIKAPNGRIYQIDGPAGATDAQVRAKVLEQHPDAGQASSAPKPRTAMQQTGDIITNAVAGAAQGITAMPDTAVEGISALMRMGVAPVAKASAGMFRGLGMGGAADSVDRNARTFDRALAAPATGYRAVEAVAPTRPGYENSRFAAQLVGGMAVPFGPKKTAVATIPVPRPAVAASPARDVLAAGAREGVPVYRTDIKPPRTAMGRGARWLGEKIPFAGTGGMREGQQTKRIEAIQNVLTDFGGNAERTMLDDTASAANAVASNLATTRGNSLGRLTQQKQAVIANLSRNNEVVPVDRTVSAIDDQIAALTRRGTPAAQEAAKTLQGYRSALQGKTLDQLEAIRADELANAFKGGNALADVKVVGEKALRSIYDPLRAEMGTFIRQRGGEKALSQWAKANENLSSMAGELKSARFKNVLRNEELTPESVKNLLFSHNRSDVARLMGNLDKRGQGKAREAILQRAYDGSIGTDGLSAERFISNVNRLGPSITEAFKGPDLQRVQGLTRLLDATRRAAEAGRMPATGAQNTPLLVAAGMLQTLGQTGTAVVGGGYGLLARAYESTPVRKELARLAATKPGTRFEAETANRAAIALTLALREQMAKAANTNVPLRVSAGETPEDNQRQQRGF